MAPIFVQCKDFFGTRIPISKNLIFREILISQISANNGETRKNIRIRIRGILLSSKGSRLGMKILYQELTMDFACLTIVFIKKTKIKLKFFS